MTGQRLQVVSGLDTIVNPGHRSPLVDCRIQSSRKVHRPRLGLDDPAYIHRRRRDSMWLRYRLRVAPVTGPNSNMIGGDDVQ